MKKMMFLALALSVMAMGSVSASDLDRKPGGLVVGFNGNGGFVKVEMGAPKPSKRPSCCCDLHHNPPRKHHKKAHANWEKRNEIPRGKHPHNCPSHGPYHNFNGGRPTPPPPAHRPGYGYPGRPGGPVRR